MVESGGYGRVGSEQVGGPGRSAGRLEIALAFILPAESPLDQRQGAMALIEVA